MGRCINILATVVFILFLCQIAKSEEIKARFMPENTLSEKDGIFESNVSEAQFYHILNLGESIYKPIVEKLGYKLTVEKNWHDSTVNAYAKQVGKEMIVAMFGGLARRPEVTEEGLALVFCHEIGHHLAGFPTYNDVGGKWAASEGNADFFSTAACAKKLLWGTVEPDPNKDFEAYCGILKEQKDQWQCYSILQGAVSLANLLATLNGDKADINKMDPREVSRTLESYPATTQCRLDTYRAGALCDQLWNHSYIPKTREQMRKISCDTRPRCWYNPNR